MIGKELERDSLAQLEIVGSIYLAHAAFTQQPNNSISLEQHCAGNKPSVVDGIVRLSCGLNRGLAGVETLRSPIVEYCTAAWTGSRVETDLFRASGAVEVTGDHRARILAELPNLRL